MSATHAQIGAAAHKTQTARRIYPFIPPSRLGNTTRVPVIIAGAGPVGLAMAIELANHGIRSIVLERDNTLSDGSRAICWAKRTLEICDRLGVAASMVAKGITWNIGKVFCGTAPEPLYTFDLLPVKEQKFPAFINLQQFYTEELLVDRLQHMPLSELRWQHEVAGVANAQDGVTVTVHTQAGDYALQAEYLIAADGCRSPLRTMLGLEFEGRVFEDNFLIADIRTRVDLPAERRFWFKAPFNAGRTALMHRQPDDIWRLDFQLGWNIDREDALREENVSAKVRGMLGADIDFEYEWVSIYTFQCRRLQRFVHDRVIFAGDAAHLVSPFGARGANGGLQDVDNLGWKLALVLKALAPASLLASYDDERIHGADENILNSSRATDFLTPKSPVSTAFRDAALELAGTFPFGRAFVNSGRLSTPCTLDRSPLTTPDRDEFATALRPGSPCVDAPVVIGETSRWFLEFLGGEFAVVYFTDDTTESALDLRALTASELKVGLFTVTSRAGPQCIGDPTGLLAQRYDGKPGTTYLIRPDQHIAARWRSFDSERLLAALRRATGRH